MWVSPQSNCYASITVSSFSSFQVFFRSWLFCYRLSAEFTVCCHI